MSADGDGPILALDASTLSASAVLAGPGDTAWERWEQAPGTRGTAELAAALADLLAARDLSPGDLAGLVVGTGPGSYTGLRAAIALVRGVAMPLGLPLAGVPSVAAAALGLLRAHPEVERVVTLVDARRDEAYRADYARDCDGITEALAPCLQATASLAALEAEPPPGVLIIREPVPDPLDLAILGRPRLAASGDDPALIVPLYLKPSHAELALRERQAREG